MAFLIYTSGTTGLPKATIFSYGRSLMGDALAYSGLIAFYILAYHYSMETRFN